MPKVEQTGFADGLDRESDGRWEGRGIERGLRDDSRDFWSESGSMKLPPAGVGRRARGRFGRKGKEFSWEHIKCESLVKYPGDVA